MKDNIFILGGSHLQLEFIKRVKQNGYSAIVFDHNNNCIGAEFADYFYCISIEEKEKIFKIAKKLKPIAIHSVATEKGNLSACYLSEKLGLISNSYKTAIETTNKVKMKSKFKNNNIRTADYIIANSIKDLEGKNLQFPLIIKPANSSAGRGVFFVESMAELERKIDISKAFDVTQTVLIENFINGKQYSIETISFSGQHHLLAVTREFFLEEKLFAESHHLLPAFEENEILQNYRENILEILDIFNIYHGASHIEFRINKKGINIIEVASRMGGFRDTMLFHSKKIDYNQLIINSITGLKYDFKNTLTKFNYSLAKMIYNAEELNFLNSLECDIHNPIVNKNINSLDFSCKPSNLMDSKGTFYLLYDDKSKVEIFLKMVNKINSNRIYDNE